MAMQAAYIYKVILSSTVLSLRLDMKSFLWPTADLSRAVGVSAL